MDGPSKSTLGTRTEPGLKTMQSVISRPSASTEKLRPSPETRKFTMVWTDPASTSRSPLRSFLPSAFEQNAQRRLSSVMPTTSLKKDSYSMVSPLMSCA